MILSDIGIQQAPRSGRLGITPTPLVLQPASVDLTLGESILVPANRRAGFVDPGFQGQLTLELANLSPDDILLYPGMPIGQLCFYTLDQPCMHPYGSPQVGSHYQGQAGATAARGAD